MNNSGNVAVSIISHGHGQMVSHLVAQLLNCPEVSKIIITVNIPEKFLLPENSKIQLINNQYPSGFSKNHNFAFKKINDDYFCPINPDVRLLNNPFPRLIEVQKKYGVELVAPIVVNKFGEIEDSVRYFPTLMSLAKKLFLNESGSWDVSKGKNIFYPEWVAGMFMFFDSTAFKKLDGFDEKYYLYYEDVDICARLWNAGMRLVVDPSTCIIHDARRASRRNIAHMKLHFKSMLRYFIKYFMRLPKIYDNTKNG